MFKSIIKKIINAVLIFKFNLLNQGKIRSFKVAFWSSSIDKSCNVRSGTYLYNVQIGYATYISEDCFFVNAKFGKFCSIAPNVKLYCGEHPLRDFVSTHPAFYAVDANTYTVGFSDNDYFGKIKKNKDGCYLSVGNDVWIAGNVSIIAGISIGDGAVVLPGAVVNRDIPPYEIWGGIPARKIKDRFTSETKEYLLNFKWWDKDPCWLKSNYKIFHDIGSFIDLTKENEGDG